MQEVSRRTRQVASQIRDELVRITQRELNDPRIAKVGMITFTSVDLSPDHENALVFVSFMGQEEKSPLVQDALAALDHAKGFFRKHLSKRMTARVIPRLTFRYDTIFDRAATINVALKEASDVEKEAAKEKEKFSTNSADDSDDSKYRE